MCLMGVNRVDLRSTHKPAMATVRMSSETASVSEPVYNYANDKHLLKRFRVHML